MARRAWDATTAMHATGALEKYSPYAPPLERPKSAQMAKATNSAQHRPINFISRHEPPRPLAARTAPPTKTGGVLSPGAHGAGAAAGGGNFIPLGKTILTSALPGQFSVAASASVPNLPNLPGAAGANGTSSAWDIDSVDAATAESMLTDMRRREKRHVNEIKRLTDALEAAQRHATSNAEKAQHERREEATSALAEKLHLEADLGRVRRECHEKIRAAEERAALAETKLVSMRGTLQGADDAIKGREREARIETLYMQMTRRLFYRDLAHAFTAWHELWSARTYALTRMLEARNRLHAPELAHAFTGWHEVCAQEAYRARLVGQFKKEAASEGAREALEDEVVSMRSEYEAKLAAAAEERALALQRQLVELTGTAEEQMALREAKEKEERIELLRRQVVRRIMYSSMSHGWSAWVELWQAKSYALATLRRSAGRLQAPALADSFVYWQRDCEMAKTAREMERAARESASAESELRRVRHENGQMQLRQVAREDELRMLRARVREYEGAAAEGDDPASVLARLEAELADARQTSLAAQEAAALAERRLAEGEEESATQRADSQKLLEELLDEQRERYERTISGLKSAGEASERRKAEEEREARIELLRRQVGRRLRNTGLAKAWISWRDLLARRALHLNALKQVAGRLHRPALARSLSVWMHDWRAEEQSRLANEAAFMNTQLLSGVDRVAALQAEMTTLRADLEAAVDERTALRAQLPIVDGARVAAEQATLEQQRVDREERVQLLARQLTRRMLSRDLAFGWTAWHGQWAARARALTQLRAVANHLHQPALVAGFSGWVKVLEAERHATKLAAHIRRSAGLQDETASLQHQLNELRDMYEAKLAAAAEERAIALQRQLVELTGTAEERQAQLEEKSREERIELLRRQVVRRIMHQSLTLGWSAWLEDYHARTRARARLQACARRLKAPELSDAFAAWEALRQEAHRVAAQLAQRRRVAALSGHTEVLEAEVARLQGLLTTAEEDRRQRTLLERQLTELTGSEAEKEAMRTATEREARVELLFRQTTRRMLHTDLAHAWHSWQELWHASSYARQRLREAANLLHAPSLSSAFYRWAKSWEATCEHRRTRELEEQSQSLDSQLRRERFANGQLEMRLVALEEERSNLRARVMGMSQAAYEHEQYMSGASLVAQEKRTLEEQLIETKEAAIAADKKRGAAEHDAASDRESNRHLLKQLLAEQRAAFDLEVAEIRKRLDERMGEFTVAAERRQAVEGELKQVKEEMVTVKTQLGEARKKVEEANRPSTVVTKPKRQSVSLPKTSPTAAGRAANPLAGIDLDESPDAPPISEQLKEALKKNAGKVLDLFRAWDADGDGVVTRSEFHRSMPALGLEVPKSSIDELFSSWDHDGGGELSLKELTKILRAPSPKVKVSPEVRKATSAAVSVTRMTRFADKMASKKNDANGDTSAGTSSSSDTP